ncbi:hypothetical protein CC86DRAFT_461346 [Ophiobolus disseminans]|uniref:DUF6536 domain-containing protein n=1 Tax=Ophiobolus disseminans TaxID=1469910 RepID=A0A6A7AHT2_9PLEO|nr:hypothetical protein CC86DRAFT_461346 [Ophiobolus disseminans]
MFMDSLNAVKRWVLSPLRSQPTTYGHITSPDSMELRNLTSVQRESKDIQESSSLSASKRSKIKQVSRMPSTTAERISVHRFTGWRTGVLHFALWSSLVFLINLVATIWGSSSSRPNRGVFYEGDCKHTKRLNSGIHVLINFLSTILLSGSNYCMQVLSAPTRKEIDTVHDSGRGRWLDIGVPGLRNLRYIGRRRLVLWCLLALSSLPLHLFYNSAVYASLSSNSYRVFSVSQSFLDEDLRLPCPDPSNKACDQRWRLLSDRPVVLQILKEKARAGELLRLSPLECIQQYAQIVQFERRNVLLVADDKFFPPAENSTLWKNSHVYSDDRFSAKDVYGPESASDAYAWICGGSSGGNGGGSGSTPCSDRIEDIKKSPDKWKTGFVCGPAPANTSVGRTCKNQGWPVGYCLSESGEPHCKLHFELGIAVAVTVLNLLKALLMFCVAFGVYDEPLLTIGDAVASFLHEHDPSTQNMCLASMSDFKQKKGFRTGPRQWRNETHRWKDVTSRRRRTTTLITFLVALAGVCALLIVGIQSVPTKSSILRLAYGSIDPRTSIAGMPNSTLANAVIANSPQVILSLLYFSYNSLMTAMVMGYEWTSYAHKRKGLRVSARPEGQQRSTYFLQLPYRFGVPLIILSGTIHWMISQSIFLLAIDFYDALGKVDDSYRAGMPYASRDYRTLGFSPAAIVSVIVMASVMVIAIIGMGYIPYSKGIPLAGSNSMAISAACHPMGENEGDENERTTAFEKLQWGVIKTSQDGVGHCGFSSNHVTAPVEGAVYTGAKE